MDTLSLIEVSCERPVSRLEPFVPLFLLNLGVLEEESNVGPVSLVSVTKLPLLYILLVEDWRTRLLIGTENLFVEDLGF